MFLTTIWKRQLSVFSIDDFTYHVLKLAEIGPNIGIWLRKLRNRWVSDSLCCTWLVTEEDGIQAKLTWVIWLLMPSVTLSLSLPSFSWGLTVLPVSFGFRSYEEASNASFFFLITSAFCLAPLFLNLDRTVISRKNVYVRSNHNRKIRTGGSSHWKLARGMQLKAV